MNFFQYLGAVSESSEARESNLTVGERDLRRFQSTCWTAVEIAGVGSEEALQALQEVLGRYRTPLTVHLEKRFRLSRTDAEDRVHDFIHKKVMMAQLLTSANRSRGRFRTFLLTALNRFVLNHIRDSQAKKRIPENQLVSLENAVEGGREPVAGGASFSLDWSETVIQSTLDRVEKECGAKGMIECWEVFRSQIIGPKYHGDVRESQQDLADRLGLASRNKVSNLVLTGKRMFRRQLREVVGEYTGDSKDVSVELGNLWRELGEGR